MAGGAKATPERMAGRSAQRFRRALLRYDPAFEDEVDVASLFRMLETQIVPLYYAKPDGRLPIAWLQLMRESIRTVVPVFNTHRMVREYAERLYEPAARGHEKLAESGGKKAVELSKWKEKIRKAWRNIRISRRADQREGEQRVCRRPARDQREGAPWSGRSGVRHGAGLPRSNVRQRNHRSENHGFSEGGKTGGRQLRFFRQCSGSTRAAVTA